MMKINDAIFGEMTYDASWEKKDTISIYGKEFEITIVAQAYSKPELQEITAQQRRAYKKYMKELDNYILKIPQILLNYYLNQYDLIKSQIDIPERWDREHINIEQIVKLIKVRTLYFDREGRYGWLCDCAWEQEHGIAIILSEDVPRVTEQDEII